VTIIGQRRVGDFAVAKSATATLTELSIESGVNPRAGGGIHNEGMLTVTGANFLSDVSYTAGGAIASDGGALTVINCTFNDNHAPIGGGIENHATLTVSNSTFAYFAVIDPVFGIFGFLAALRRFLFFFG
jgi:hypothetical protein